MNILRPNGIDGSTGLKDLDGLGWRKSQKYTQENINKFEDNAKGVAREVGNAVPSPYARMYLFKQAFDFVNKSNDVDGKSLYHRLVSHCLDVFELLYNLNTSNTNIKLVPFNINNELASLSKSFVGQQLLSNTLRIYRSNTALEKFYVDDSGVPKQLLNELFFITHNDKVIAGTSPFTCFFTSPRPHLHNFGLGLFENTPKSLENREKGFWEYMIGLYQSNLAMFEYNFKELGDYIKKVQEKKVGTPQQIEDLKKIYEETTEIIELSPGNALNVCGIRFRTIASNHTAAKIQSKSHFTINPRADFKEANPHSFIPLALMNDFNEPWNYTDENKHWNSNYKITADQITLPPLERTLPEAQKYPFITVEDLLEETILQVPYRINYVQDGKHIKKFRIGKYIDARGNELRTPPDFMYLLPIKKEFFNYFSLEALDENLIFQEIDEGIVKVSLTIPLMHRPNFSQTVFSFSRTYYEGVPPINANGYIGKIEFCRSTLAIFPFIRTNIPEIDNFYRVALLHRGDTTLKFFAERNTLKQKPQINPTTFYNMSNIVTSFRRSDNPEVEGCTDYYAISENCFDFIELNCNGINSLIVPNWSKETKKLSGTETHFAIDFGTTNTHIACQIDKGPESFSITSDDMQVAFLNAPSDIQIGEPNYKRFEDIGFIGVANADKTFIHEFLPVLLGEKVGRYTFPIRTILAEDKILETDANRENTLLQTMNIDFSYEKTADIPESTQLIHNLKWSFNNDSRNTKRVEGYITELLLLIRNKLILKGYHPHKAKIVWFYPLSMSQSHIDGLRTVWGSSYKKFFSPTGQDICINESEAPYYWHIVKSGVNSLSHVLSIDIGGGTTDVVMMYNGTTHSGTSFMFAGNALFGNLPKNPKGITNGIAKYYQKEFEKRFSYETDEHHLFREILEKNNNSESLNSYFFSCKEFNFSNQLSHDPHFVLSILFHFSSIFYHIAQLLKYEQDKGNHNIDIPTHICLSGKASNIIKIISKGNDVNYTRLVDVVAFIFKHVFEVADGDMPSIKFIISDNPKELTCLGGVLYSGPANSSLKQPVIYAGTTIDQQMTYFGEMRYSKLRDLLADRRPIKQDLEVPTDKKEKDLTDEQRLKVVAQLKQGIVSNVKEFVSLFEDMFDDIDFVNSFGVEDAVRISDIFTDRFIIDTLYDGFAQMPQYGVKDGSKLTQTLFFYPIAAGLFELNERLFQKKS